MPTSAVMAGGAFMLLAAIITLFVPYTRLAIGPLQRVGEQDEIIPAITPPESPITAE